MGPEGIAREPESHRVKDEFLGRGTQVLHVVDLIVISLVLRLQLEPLLVYLDREELVLLPVIEKDADIAEVEERLQLSMDTYHKRLVGLLLEESADHIDSLLSVTELDFRVLDLEEPLHPHLQEHAHELEHRFIDLAELGAFLGLLRTRTGALAAVRRLLIALAGRLKLDLEDAGDLSVALVLSHAYSHLLLLSDRVPMDLEDAREQNLLAKLLWVASYRKDFRPLDGEGVVEVYRVQVALLVYGDFVKEICLVSLAKDEQCRFRAIKELLYSPVEMLE